MEASPLPSLLCALALAACSSAPGADAAFQDRGPRQHECCASERARDLPGPGEPGGHDLTGDGLIVPVTPTLPALSFGAPVPVDENGGHEPRLFVEGGQLFVFHRAGSGQSLLLRRRPCEEHKLLARHLARFCFCKKEETLAAAATRLRAAFPAT